MAVEANLMWIKSETQQRYKNCLQSLIYSKKTQTLDANIY